MRKTFQTKYVENGENVRVVDSHVKEIRFNPVSREIAIITENGYTEEDLDGLSWQQIKSLVVDNGGEWTSKANGIEYMIGRPK